MLTYSAFAHTGCFSSPVKLSSKDGGREGIAVKGPMWGAADPTPSQTALLEPGSTSDLTTALTSGYFFCASAPADCPRPFHISSKQSYYFTDPGLLFTDELDAVHCSLKYYFATLNASHSFSAAIGFIPADMQLSLILDAAAIPSAKAFLYIGLQTFQPDYHRKP